MKLHVIKCSPIACYLLLHKAKYPPQHSILKLMQVHITTTWVFIHQWYQTLPQTCRHLLFTYKSVL